MNLISHPPRIPAVKTYADFRAFSQAGRDLAHWHLNYETVACHPGVVVEEALASASSQAPTVTDRHDKAAHEPPVASLYERRSQRNAETPLPLPITTSKINTHQSSFNLSSFASTVTDQECSAC